MCFAVALHVFSISLYAGTTSNMTCMKTIAFRKQGTKHEHKYAQVTCMVNLKNGSAAAEERTCGGLGYIGLDFWPASPPFRFPWLFLAVFRCAGSFPRWPCGRWTRDPLGSWVGMSNVLFHPHFHRCAGGLLDLQVTLDVLQGFPGHIPYFFLFVPVHDHDGISLLVFWSRTLWRIDR